MSGVATLADFGCGDPVGKTVVPKQQPQVKTKKKPAANDFIEAEQDYMPALQAWEKACEVNKESVIYWHFDYYSRFSLGSKEEFITGGRTFARYNHGRSDTYGGSWGCGESCRNKDEATALWKELIGSKTRTLAMPFHAEKADDFSLRGVKKENIRIFLSSKAKEYLESMGWDFTIFYKEWDSIKEGVLTPEIVAINDRYYELRASVDALNKKTWKRRHELEEIISHPLKEAQSKLIDQGALLASNFSEYIKWCKEQHDMDAEMNGLAARFRGEN